MAIWVRVLKDSELFLAVFSEFKQFVTRHAAKRAIWLPYYALLRLDFRRLKKELLSATDNERFAGIILHVECLVSRHLRMHLIRAIPCKHRLTFVVDSDLE